MEEQCEKLKCNYASHGNKAIISMCLDPNCDLKPQMCASCVKVHGDHIHKTVYITQLDAYRQSLDFTSLTKMFEDFKELFDIYIKSITQELQLHEGSVFEGLFDKFVKTDCPDLKQLESFGKFLKHQIELDGGKCKQKKFVESNLLNKQYHDFLVNNMQTIITLLGEMNNQEFMKDVYEQENQKELKKQIEKIDQIQLIQQEIELFKVQHELEQQELQDKIYLPEQKAGFYQIEECLDEFKLLGNYIDFPYLINHVTNMDYLNTVDLNYAGNELLSSKNLDFDDKGCQMLFSELTRLASGIMHFKVNFSLTNCLIGIDEMAKTIGKCENLEYLSLNLRSILFILNKLVQVYKNQNHRYFKREPKKVQVLDLLRIEFEQNRIDNS